MSTARLYKFPLDLDSNTLEYPHRITFQALKSRANSPTPAKAIPNDPISTSP